MELGSIRFGPVEPDLQNQEVPLGPDDRTTDSDLDQNRSWSGSEVLIMSVCRKFGSGSVQQLILSNRTCRNRGHVIVCARAHTVLNIRAARVTWLFRFRYLDPVLVSHQSEPNPGFRSALLNWVRKNRTWTWTYLVCGRSASCSWSGSVRSGVKNPLSWSDLQPRPSSSSSSSSAASAPPGALTIPPCRERAYARAFKLAEQFQVKFVPGGGVYRFQVVWGQRSRVGSAQEGAWLPTRAACLWRHQQLVETDRNTWQVLLTRCEGNKFVYIKTCHDKTTTTCLSCNVNKLHLQNKSPLKNIWIRPWAPPAHQTRISYLVPPGSQVLSDTFKWLELLFSSKHSTATWDVNKQNR